MNKNDFLLYLDQYLLLTGDEYTKRFFDRSSNKNLDYKYKVLDWALLTGKLPQTYPNFDHDMFYENYKDGEMWDL